MISSGVVERGRLEITWQREISQNSRKVSICETKKIPFEIFVNQNGYREENAEL